MDAKNKLSIDCPSALWPQNYIMDIKESERFSNNSYPKLKLLFDAKMGLLAKRNPPPIVFKVKTFLDLDFMDLISDHIRYDVIMMRLPVPQTIVDWQEKNPSIMKS